MVTWLRLPSLQTIALQDFQHIHRHLPAHVRENREHTYEELALDERLRFNKFKTSYQREILYFHFCIKLAAKFSVYIISTTLFGLIPEPKDDTPQAFHLWLALRCFRIIKSVRITWPTDYFSGNRNRIGS